MTSPSTAFFCILLVAGILGACFLWIGSDNPLMPTYSLYQTVEMDDGFHAFIVDHGMTLEDCLTRRAEDYPGASCELETE